MDNKSEKRHEVLIDRFTVRMDYIKAKDKIYLMHTKYLHLRKV